VIPTKKPGGKSRPLYILFMLYISLDVVGGSPGELSPGSHQVDGLASLENPTKNPG
jgi:hypothetical protein